MMLLAYHVMLVDSKSLMNGISSALNYTAVVVILSVPWGHDPSHIVTQLACSCASYQAS